MIYMNDSGLGIGITAQPSIFNPKCLCLSEIPKINWIVIEK